MEAEYADLRDGDLGCLRKTAGKLDLNDLGGRGASLGLV